MKHENPLWQQFYQIMTESRASSNTIWEMYKKLPVQELLAIIDAVRNARYKGYVEGMKDGTIIAVNNNE